jgi:hypothetical protein
MMSEGSQKEQMIEEIGESASRRNVGKNLLIFGLLLLLLGGGAYTAGHLLGDQEPLPKSEGITKADVEGDSVTQGAIRLKPDERLPVQMPTTVGQFHHRQDNRIYINQYPPPGQMVILAEIDTYPLMEIVVTKKTVLFKDVTDLSSIHSSDVVQQIVAPGSLEDLDSRCSLFVWGEQRGERIIADVLQYSKN